MLSRHRVSRVAIELIKQFEGYRRQAAQLPDGRWTIGYGHTLTAREGADVSLTDAEALLVYDLISVGHAVNENTLAPIGQNQFDALCSFSFNLGLDNFRRSQVLKRLNAGAMVQAACAMELWRKADFEGERIVVDALVRRRAVEKALFLTPDGGVFVAAPSPLLRPVMDLDAQDLVPARRPVAVETSLVGERVEARRDDIADSDPVLEAETAPEPSPAITAAAEAVTGRLSSLFADPGLEPEPPVPDADLRPQADFAEPITVEVDPEPEPQSEPEGYDAEPLTLEAASETDLALDIPQAPALTRFDDDGLGPQVTTEIGPSTFIPARNRPPPPRREPSVVWDLLLGLVGLAFFGFAVFAGVTTRTIPVEGFPNWRFVAWSAGLAGVGFTVVAVFRLLQRLGRAAERA